MILIATSSTNLGPVTSSTAINTTEPVERDRQHESTIYAMDTVHEESGLPPVESLTVTSLLPALGSTNHLIDRVRILSFNSVL